jgi:tetratricopeptide (TPR) repeat protein
MRCMLALRVTVLALMALSGAWSVSPAAAEPILDEQSIAPPVQAAPEKTGMTEAVSLFKVQDYGGALKLLGDIASKDANMPPAQVIMAQWYEGAGLLKESKDALAHAAIESPNEPEVWLFMANAALRNNDMAKAASLYQKAGGLLATFNKSAQRKDRLQKQLQGGRIALAMATKDWSAAQKAFDDLLKADPKNALVLRRLAYCLYQQKKPDGALAKLQEAAKIDSTAVAPQAILAQFFQESGDRENARKWMAAAIDAAPKDIKTRLAVGQFALDTGNIEEARKQANAAMQIAPKSADAKFFRGVIAMLEKEYEGAESYFESVLKQSPKNFIYSNNLIFALIAQDDKAKNQRALDQAEANMRQYPGSADAAATLGWVLYKMGRLDDAERSLRGAASVANSDIDAAYFTARVAVDRGRNAEAKKMLENALKNGKPFVFRRDAEELLKQLQK